MAGGHDWGPVSVQRNGSDEVVHKRMCANGCGAVKTETYKPAGTVDYEWDTDACFDSFPGGEARDGHDHDFGWERYDADALCAVYRCSRCESRKTLRYELAGERVSRAECS